MNILPKHHRGTVFIIGAGPGHPDLMTIAALKVIKRVLVILYTGSLVPKEVFSKEALPEALIVDSSSMTLDAIMDMLKDASFNGKDVARVHTGDPLIFGSTAEQMRRMEQEGIPYEIIPGVSSMTAAAAAIKKELTLPEISQTVIATRVEGRTPMPMGQDLASMGKHRATLALFLSITLLKKVVRDLTPHYGKDCPIVVVHKASCPEEVIVWGCLLNIIARVQQKKITSQSMIFVGQVLTEKDFPDSRLYAADFSHSFRKSSIQRERREKKI